MDEKIMIGVIMITLCASASFIIATIVNAITRTRRERGLADVQSKLIDRLGTGADVMAYANTDAFKNMLTSDTPARGIYVTRVLNTLQSGIIMLCAGVGMTLVALLDGEIRLFLQVVGGILIAVGVGLSISAGWSYALLRRWGLLVENQKQS